MTTTAQIITQIETKPENQKTISLASISNLFYEDNYP
jgi:hypothetical protein